MGLHYRVQEHVAVAPESVLGEEAEIQVLFRLGGLGAVVHAQERMYRGEIFAGAGGKSARADLLQVGQVVGHPPEKNVRIGAQAGDHVSAQEDFFLAGAHHVLEFLLGRYLFVGNEPPEVRLQLHEQEAGVNVSGLFCFFHLLSPPPA